MQSSEVYHVLYLIETLGTGKMPKVPTEDVELIAPRDLSCEDEAYRGTHLYLSQGHGAALKSCCDLVRLPRSYRRGSWLLQHTGFAARWLHGFDTPRGYHSVQ